MIYRKLGKTGINISEIGMGLEHLLDKEENIVIDTIRTAINGGVNYFDCLSLLEYSKISEKNDGYVKLGKAIKGYRKNIYLAFLAYVSKELSYIKNDFENYLHELDTSYTDIFLLACCDRIIDFEKSISNGDLLEYVKVLKAEGKVNHIGISTHNTEIAYRAINSGFFDVLMYPINPAFDIIVDEEKYNSDILGNIWDAAYNYKPIDGNVNLPRKNIYNECKRNEIGLVGMKPFAGGFILNVEKEAGYTPLNLISYVLAQNGVSTVIPGCSNQREIEEILRYYSCTEKELDYSEAIAKSRWSVKGNCLYCHHCLPCPNGINIVKIIKLLDSNNNREYNELTVKASSCKKCGVCENRCPFKVKIIEKMKIAEKIFEKGNK